MSDDKTREAHLEQLSVPTIHLNGTPATRLQEALRAAGDALYEAEIALRECAPNGRDYYTQGPDAINKATREHRERQQLLARVTEEIGHIYGRIL